LVSPPRGWVPGKGHRVYHVKVDGITFPFLLLSDHIPGGEIQVAEKLRVAMGAAEYGRPEIQQIITVR